MPRRGQVQDVVRLLQPLLRRVGEGFEQLPVEVLGEQVPLVFSEAVVELVLREGKVPEVPRLDRRVARAEVVSHIAANQCDVAGNVCLNGQARGDVVGKEPAALLDPAKLGS